MRMVAAVSPPTAGELSILGMDPATQGPQIRARIGVCPQEDTLDTELSIRDNLVVYGRYFGLARSECAVRADALRAAHQKRPLDAEELQQMIEVLMMRIRLGGRLGISEATPVVTYDPVILSEDVELIVPHPAISNPRMNQNERLPFSGYLVVKLCAANLSKTIRHLITHH
jgi:hypothetical protein